MAKQKKTTKKERTSSQKSKGNGALNLIIGLFILLIVSLFIAYFYINYHNKEKSITTTTQTPIAQNTVDKSENKNNNATKESEIVEENVNIFSDKTTLEGTWVSIHSGSMLTISGNSYSIDFSSVETSNPIRGTFTLSDFKIIFSSDDTDAVCGLTKGSYLVDFSDTNIEFKVIKDPCPKRKNTLESEWFRF
ncbi:MAG: hypothetical protein LBM67_09405 [Lentimicrobiaceae bacterium]|jgi:hypothetical protein|nr:hypothetical protein [Lentimicrobiaceae bacterium]